MGNKKRRDMIGSSSHAPKEVGFMRDSQNLVVERRQQGNKMGIKKKRENRFGSAALAFASD
jgi:hypothetical protein